MKSVVALSPPPDASLVLLLEYISRMKIEGGSGSRVGAAEFGVTAVTDREIFQPPVNKQIDERRTAENAVRDEVASKPVEDAADERADDHHGQPDLRIEILSPVEIGAVTHRAAIDSTIGPQRVADLQADAVPAPSALDFIRLLIAADGQAGVTIRASREDLQGSPAREE